ncbi:MAG TPA: META domain-containing protein [Chromatiaceae bacterium]|nr:META domain-containing protein [Chromatiaceae bacterium]
MKTRKKLLQWLPVISVSFALIVTAAFAADDSQKPLGKIESEIAETPDSSADTGAARELVESFELHGDLDGDGDQEIVLALRDMPGNGVAFHYLVILEMDRDRVKSRSLFVGDRIKILGGEIAGNRITIDLLEQAPDDPACCPTQKLVRTWEMEKDGSFRELPVKLAGKLSVEDIAGTEWILANLNDQAMPENPQINLIYEAGRISGSGGCNNYFSEMKDLEAEAGNVKVGPVGSTRKVCPDDIMELEGNYLKHLGQVTRFSFTGKQLILSWRSAQQSGTLVFTPGRKLE